MSLIKSKGVKLLIVTLSLVVVFNFAIIAQVKAQTIEELQDQITALLVQVQTLQAQLAVPQSGSTVATNATKCKFIRDLTIGSTGADVSCLQNYLSGTGHFTYTGGATGYFGPITQSAVAAWQADNGVFPTAGYLGSTSRARYSLLATSLVNSVNSEALTVIYPNGGESFDANDSIGIQWTGTQTKNEFFRVSLVGDPNQPYCLSPYSFYPSEQVLHGELAGNSFTIEEGVMSKITEGNICQFKIKVQSTTNKSISDQSDDYFKVTP